MRCLELIYLIAYKWVSACSWQPRSWYSNTMCRVDNNSLYSWCLYTVHNTLTLASYYILFYNIFSLTSLFSKLPNNNPLLILVSNILISSSYSSISYNMGDANFFITILSSYFYVDSYVFRMMLWNKRDYSS